MTGPAGQAQPGTLSRRGLGRAALAALLATGCTSPIAPPLLLPPARVDLAAGEEGGFYVEFAELLAAALRADGVSRVSVLRTPGSIVNIGLVRDGQAAVGLAQADSVQDALPSAGGRIPLRAIGRVYEDYLQLVVRAEDERFRTPSDLAGAEVSLGSVGSGAASFGERLLGVVGVTPRLRNRPLRDAVAALERGTVDAVLWSGGIPTPAFDGLASRRPVRLLPLGTQVGPLRARYGPTYRSVVLPAGLYGGAAPVSTVGVPNLLVCRADLPDATAASVVRTLVASASELVPESALGTQYLEQRSLIGTGALALHPGAADAYRTLHG